MPFKAQKAVFSKLLDVADVSTLSRKDRLRYEEALKGYRDYHATMDYAKEEGFEKGRKEGIKEGRVEERREVARTMKLKGIDNMLIAEITHLSLEEIKNCKE